MLNEIDNIKLYAFDPEPEALSEAQNKLESYNVEFLSTKALKNASFQADVIVSFSVYEHVYERENYLNTAFDHLESDGTFYLNYDDGHFRNTLSLNEPRKWYREVKVWVKNLLVEPLASIGLKSFYQSRVPRDRIDRAVKEAGFEISEAFYSNLEDFKGFVKTLSEDKKQQFMKFWIDTEKRLNDEFRLETSETNLDPCNLWEIMGSRTLVLRKSD